MTIISSTSCSRTVIKKQMISWSLVEIYVYMPLIHGSEFSCRYRAFCYTVSLVYATNSGERLLYMDLSFHAGIEPFVTLYHWYMPQTLENECGGFRSKRVV